MSDQPWLDDPLGYLLGADGKAEFLRTHHEKSWQLGDPGDPAHYAGLLSLARIDELIASLDFDAGQLDMTRADPPISREDFTFANDRVDRGAVARLFQNGATIILPQLHESDRRLGDFCRAMQDELSCHVQTNIYLTPPDAQGFKTHYDGHDVFVLQVSGAKRWRLYDTPVENPFRGEGFHPGRHEIGEPVEDFVLEAGQCLYVPRGMMHDALTHGEEPSLHITVGLIVKTWADLMLEAVSEVALRHPAFRRALPIGHARPDFDREEARRVFRQLTQTLAAEAEFDDSLDVFIDNFIRSRLPDSQGAIVNATAPESPGALFKLRPRTPWRLAEDGDELVIITAGGEIRFPAAAEAGLHTLLDGGEISTDSFPDLEAEARLDTLKKLYAFGLAVPVERGEA